MADKLLKSENFISGYIDTAIVSNIDTKTGNDIGISFSVDQVWPKDAERQTDESAFEVVQTVLASFTMTRSQAKNLANLLLRATDKND
ncbi:hypothetical protein [Shewanella fodinae]|uniref:hypothetical protein n=1 Tax=Shewanella fodinae TaxID=552357 RepID=UPI001675DDD0|nr:hypothetical protein [Shewanella fodinae]MCL2905200.1 hypothetical protein [Shewanella fodinae]GGY87837.1 hypothetical protein GCM10007169_01250 [Shewanella fodinae]